MAGASRWILFARRMRDGFVQEIIEQYKLLPEWPILDGVRATVLEIEQLIGKPTGEGV